MTTLRVRTSERKDFAHCRQRWYWGYVERLKSRSSAPALKFGDLVHQALALWYPPGVERGIEPWVTFETLFEELDTTLSKIWTEEGEKEDAFELGQEMLLNYVETFGQDEGIEIIAPEQSFQVPFFDAEYVGQIDAVARYVKTGKVFFLEHKTSAGLPPRIWMEMDEQGGSYYAFGVEWLRKKKILKPKEDIDGVLYNILRKAKMDLRPTNEEGQALNKDGTVSQKQPSPLFHRQPVYRNQAMRDNLRSRVAAQMVEMDEIRRGVRAPTKNISDDCKFCPFRDMCELHERDADWEEFRDAMYVKWEPYEAHLPIPTEETR